MNDEALMSIGGFSLASSLSIAALRHYDEVGVLTPAHVDPTTGYRRYRPDQLAAARVVRALREIQVPLDVVREILAEPDGTVRVLCEHRAALAARAEEFAAMVRTTDRYISQGGIMSTLATARIVQVTVNVTDLAASIAFYQEAFDAGWDPEISSLQLGTYPGDDFFLLTIARDEEFGPSRFGLTVADVDTAHRRALAAGATEAAAPEDAPWKPRSSAVVDPGGNLLTLFQG